MYPSIYLSIDDTKNVESDIIGSEHRSLGKTTAKLEIFILSGAAFLT